MNDGNLAGDILASHTPVVANMAGRVTQGI